MQIHGDPKGVEALKGLAKNKEADLADALAAAKQFGRAFIREDLDASYRLWEIGCGGAEEPRETNRPGEEGQFEVRLFLEGKRLTVKDRSVQ